MTQALLCHVDLLGFEGRFWPIFYDILFLSLKIRIVVIYFWFYGIFSTEIPDLLFFQFNHNFLLLSLIFLYFIFLLINRLICLSSSFSRASFIFLSLLLGWFFYYVFRFCTSGDSLCKVTLLFFVRLFLNFVPALTFTFIFHDIMSFSGCADFAIWLIARVSWVFLRFRFWWRWNFVLEIWLPTFTLLLFLTSFFKRFACPSWFFVWANFWNLFLTLICMLNDLFFWLGLWRTALLILFFHFDRYFLKF